MFFISKKKYYNYFQMKNELNIIEYVRIYFRIVL